jgi:hypothetical protein
MKSLLRDIVSPKERTYYSTHETGTTYGTSSFGTATSTRLEPTFVEKKERAPVIQETVLPEERVEIQPIIHREREQLEVHQVVQPMKEKDIVATEIRTLVRPAETRQEVRESDLEFQRKYQDELLRYKSGMNVQPVKHERFEKPPIIEEVIRKKVIEEVQPIIYRETIRPVIIQETLPIYEKIVEAPRMFVEEQRSVIDLGVKNLSFEHYGTTTGYQPLYSGQTRTTGQQPLSGQPVTTTSSFGGQTQFVEKSSLRLNVSASRLSTSQRRFLYKLSLAQA